MSSAELDVQESLAALESMLDNGAATASNLVSDEPVTSHEERIKFIRELPKLTERDIQDLDDVCPICQDTFLSVIALEEMAYAMDSPGLPEENLGVTKLSCGHRFCRKDLTMWTASSFKKNTCPTCRAVLPISAPPSLAIASLASPEDVQSIYLQIQASLQANSRLEQSGPTGSERVVLTPLTFQVPSGGPETEYQEDRESFGMYS